MARKKSGTKSRKPRATGTGARRGAIDASAGEYARAIVETIHEHLVVVDSEFRILSVNRSFCDLFQSPAETLQGQSLFELGDGQFDVPRLRALLADALSRGTEIKEFELDGQFPGMGRRHFLLNARQIRTSQTILIAMQDFTERKRAEEELQKGEATIRALLESSRQSIIAVDANQQIVMANGSTEKTFGYKRGELLGQPLKILIPAPLRERHAEHHQAYFAHMQSRPMGTGLILSGLRKDGATFPLEVSLSAVDTAAGKLAVAFVSDITERKRAELAAQTNAGEVRALAGSLLQAQEEERRRVARDLHDQICQQLASLAIDIGGLAAESPNPKDAQSRLKALQARVVKASEEVRHLAYQLHPSVLEDLGLIAALRALAKDFSKQEGLGVEFLSEALPGPLPREIASCLYRVAQESLHNVATHASAKQVTVKLASEKGRVSLTIQDDGVGFDPVAVKGQGGLGLIGMEERARLVNGKLSIESQPGRGTRIALEVPIPVTSGTS